MGVMTSKWVEGELVTEVLFKGWVVGTESTYLGDCDSAYYAIYFDVEAAEFKTYGLGYEPSGVVIDAPEEVKEAWAMEKEAKRATAAAASYARVLREAHFAALAEAAAPTAGKTVTVVKGRKVAKGTTGVVKVNCEGNWGRRVLLSLPDGTEVWTDAGNVEVVPAVTEEVAA